MSRTVCFICNNQQGIAFQPVPTELMSRTVCFICNNQQGIVFQPVPTELMSHFKFSNFISTFYDSEFGAL